MAWISDAFDVPFRSELRRWRSGQRAFSLPWLPRLPALVGSRPALSCQSASLPLDRRPLQLVQSMVCRQSLKRIHLVVCAPAVHKEDMSWPACARTNHAVRPSPGKSSRRNSRPLEPVLEHLLLNLVLEVGTSHAPHAGVALCTSCVPVHSRTLSNFPNMVEDKCRCIACIFADCPLVPWPSFAWPAFPRSSGPAPQ